jgi:orotate phosphoribosyltransferase
VSPSAPTYVCAAYTRTCGQAQAWQAFFSAACLNFYKLLCGAGKWRKQGRSVNEQAVIEEFRAAGALLEGHFILSSGLRSSRYLQCARVLANPARAERLATAVAACIPDGIRAEIDAVISPAVGGIIAGHEVARALGVDAMFVERPDGVFGLRRGFSLSPGQKILMMEDVVTTGLSSREAIAAIEAEGGVVIAAAALVDRSNGSVDLGVPFFPLIRLDVPTYAADSLPPELAAIPAIKPGSRKEPL